MVAEKERVFLDFVKMVSTGTNLRIVIDDLVRSDLGAMIVFDSPELYSQNLFEGGFRINCRFTTQKLFELCKMDGAVIVSADLQRILYANVLMTPDSSVYTDETGTRHKASERVAKQAGNLVITVSERKRKTTLYYSNSKYVVKTPEELIRNISSSLHVLEKQRELFNEQKLNLNVLEMSDLASVSDVCKAIQRAEMILKISDNMKRSFLEMGKEGNIMHMRYRELIRGVEKSENEIIRDYSSLTLKKTRNLLDNITFDGLLDIDSIARLVVGKSLEENISPRGFRFLSNMALTEREVSQIVKNFGSLKKILEAESLDFEQFLKGRSGSVKEGLKNLREQILSGKVTD